MHCPGRTKKGAATCVATNVGALQAVSVTQNMRHMQKLHVVGFRLQGPLFEPDV